MSYDDESSYVYEGDEEAAQLLYQIFAGAGAIGPDSSKQKAEPRQNRSYRGRKVDDVLHEVDDWMIMQERLRRMTAITTALDGVVNVYIPGIDKQARFRLERDGQVIRFKQRFNRNERTYSYSAMYIEDVKAWFTTGSSCPKKGFPTIDHLLYYYHALSGTILEMQLFPDNSRAWSESIRFDTE